MRLRSARRTSRSVSSRSPYPIPSSSARIWRDETVRIASPSSRHRSACWSSSQQMSRFRLRSGSDAGSGGAEESPEVGAFPLERGAVEAELPLLSAESRGMEGSSTTGGLPEPDRRVEHLMVHDVVHEEARDERPVQGRVHADNPPIPIVRPEIDRSEERRVGTADR